MKGSAAKEDKFWKEVNYVVGIKQSFGYFEFLWFW